MAFSESIRVPCRDYAYIIELTFVQTERADTCPGESARAIETLLQGCHLLYALFTYDRLLDSSSQLALVVKFMWKASSAIE